jgi:hypothetical protein
MASTRVPSTTTIAATPRERQGVRHMASPGAAKVGPDGLLAFPLADIGEGIAECEVIQWYTTTHCHHFVITLVAVCTLLMYNR